MAKISRRRKKKTPSTLATPHVPDKSLAFSLIADFLDLPALACVVSYDAPTSAQDYVHRVGRAGRRGRPGAALTLYTSDDAPRLRAVAKAARRAGCADVPSFLAADVPRRAWDAAAGEGRDGSRRKRRKGPDK